METNETIALYNPTETTLEATLLNDNNEEVQYSIPSHEIGYFAPHIAPLIEKRLVDAVINERELGLNEIYNEEYMKKVKEEIRVEL